MLHIAPDDLERYVLGELDTATASLVEAHLDSCATCLAAASRDARSDLLFEQLARETEVCPACERVLEAERCDYCGAASHVAGYRVRRLHVSNNHGRLYVAVDADGREVALKELCFVQPPSPDAVDAFARESRILCTLHHPQLPRFIGAFEQGEGIHTRLYLVQELVAGESLETRLATHRYDEAEIVDIARQVLAVLVYLQDLQPMVVHRDIKPANLIRRPDGTIVLVDFGAARDHAGTAGTTQVGTFGYMPTEQLAGITDATTDPYALGASLVRLLTRREAWRLVDGAWPDLGVSPKLRRWLRTLTAPRPEQRFPTARAALAALDKPRRRAVPFAVGGAAAVLVTSAVMMMGKHASDEGPPAPPDAAVVVAPAPAPPPPPPPKPVRPTPPQRMQPVPSVPPVHSYPQQAYTIPPSESERKPHESCARGPLSKLALFKAVAALKAHPDDAHWSDVFGFAGAYRTALEGQLGSDSRAPEVRRFRANAKRSLGTDSGQYRSNAVIVVDGDVDAGELVNDSLIIATGDVYTTGYIRNSVVIAGGCVNFGMYTDQSMILAGTRIESSREMDFRAAMVAAPEMATDRSKKLRPKWETVYAALAAVREPEPLESKVTCTTGSCSLRFTPGTVVRIPAAGYDDLGDITIEAWVKPVHQEATRSVLVGRGSTWSMDAGNGLASFETYSSRQPSRMGGGDGMTVHVSDALPVGGWTHLAMVYDAGAKKKLVYINGKLAAQEGWSQPIDHASQLVELGRGFDGVIDEVRIWKRARTRDEIEDNRKKRLRGTEEGLVGYYTFDEGSGEAIVDHTRNHNDGWRGEQEALDGAEPEWASDTPF